MFPLQYVPPWMPSCAVEASWTGAGYAQPLVSPECLGCEGRSRRRVLSLSVARILQSPGHHGPSLRLMHDSQTLRDCCRVVHNRHPDRNAVQQEEGRDRVELCGLRHGTCTCRAEELQARIVTYSIM